MSHLPAKIRNVGLADLRAAALERLDDAVSIFDTAGQLVFVNDAWCRLTGCAATSVLGSPWRRQFGTSNESGVTEHLEAAIADGRAWHGELWMKSADGGELLARCTLSPIEFGGEACSHYAAVWRDITGFRRAAERQRAYEASFRALIEHAPDGIAVETGGVFLYANPALVTYLGHAGPAALVGGEFSQIVSPEERKKVTTILRNLANGAEPDGPFEVRLLRADGTAVLAETTAIRSIFDGVPATLTTFRDLSVRRQLETRLMEADRMVSIGTLAAGIAHEINTPIQFVGDSAHFLGGAFQDLFQLLGMYRAFANRVVEQFPDDVAALREEEEVVDAEYLVANVPQAVQRTLDGVSRVATIVRAMKEFGHPGVAEATPADLNHALQATITVARNELKYVADVVTDLGDIPPVVCQIGGMNQVFLNMLVNAAHAIAERHKGTDMRGTITVRTRREAEMVRISIADTGCGIPEHIRARVFDPFFTTKEVGKGTGQGLAIARNIIIEKHRGRIELESTTHVGTTFHILVPVDGPPVSE